MAAADVDGQLLLFPNDHAADLGRSLFETAWLVLQHRSYLTDALYADLVGTLAYFRETLVSRTYAEKLARDVMAGVVQRPRYGPVPRPVQPPTIARLAG